MDNVNIAIALAEVRKTGATNMIDRYKVIDVMELLGYRKEAKYILNNKDKYIELLNLSANY